LICPAWEKLLTKNVAGNVDEQPWTDAFEKRSTEGFEAALAPDVVLNASSLVKPIVGRDLVKICMGTASTMYEHLAFLAQAKGNWADYAVVPADLLLPVPDDLPDEQVASFFINPASAIVMLRHVLAIPQGEWLLQSAAGSEIGRMIIKLAKHDGIRTINVVRRHASVAELERLGADAVIVSTEGPIDEQVRRIVGPQGVKYAIDPVVGETGTQMYQALGEEGRMLVYGSLTGEPIRVGADPRLILAGRRILEVFWLGYWFSKLDETVRTDLVQEIVTLLRDGILVTSTAARTFSLDEIRAAVTQAESIGRQGKVLLVPEKQ
jgi:NADPH:quinone reductase